MPNPNTMRPRNQGNANAADKPSAADTQQTSQSAEATEAKTEETETKDTVVVESETPAPVEASAEEVTAAPEPEPELSEEDSGLVGKLNEQLTALTEEASRPGRSPEDFGESAQIVQQITRFVVRTPRQTVLDRLLAFFEENADGVAAANVYLRGVSTLSNSDQQQVTYLHTLFSDLAAKRATKVNNTQLVQVLKKPEIGSYYRRKSAAFQ